ncbi:MAG: YceI family protein [Chitinophagaceae bacterium]|nr:YceI family protein [Chitinophagaceae bacterium]
MKKTIISILLLAVMSAAFAQKKTTTSAIVTFDATTPKDDLPKAENKTVIGSIDTKTGDVAFEAAVKNFNFSNPKIQEHFNAPNWMNSDQYPKITYTGKVEKINKVNFGKNGVYKVKVNGTMTIKDISKPLKVNGTITVENGKISVASSFTIKLEDYKITGQAIDAGKVAKTPKINVSATF